MTARAIRTLVAAVAAVSVLAASPAAAQGLKEAAGGAPETWLPSRTVAVLTVPDIAAARAALESGDLGKLLGEFRPFADALIAGFEEPIAKGREQFKGMTGLELYDALDAFAGGFTVALVDPEPDRERGGPPGALVALHAKGREERVAFLVAALKKHHADQGGPPLPAAAAVHGKMVDTVPVAGMPLKHFRLGDAFVFATTDKVASDVLAAASGALPATLAADADFQAARAKVASRRPILLLHANAAQLLGLVTRGDEQAAKVIHQLGFRELRAVSLGIGLGERGGLEMTLVARLPGERRGAVALLDLGPADLSTARLAPSGSTLFSAARLDLKAEADRALELAAALAPKEVEEFKAELMRVEADLGVRLKDELLASIGPDWTSFAFAGDAGPLFAESVSVVSLRDPAAFRAALEKLVARGGLKTKTIEAAGGRKLVYLMAPLGRLGEPPGGPGGDRVMVGAVVASSLGYVGSCYCIDGDRFYVADLPQTFEAYFEALAKGTLDQDPAFQAEVGRAPKGASLFTYVDPRGPGPGAYATLAKILHLVEGLVRAAGVPVETSLLPRARDVGRHLTPGQATYVFDKDGLTIHAEGTAILPGAVGVAAVSVVAAVAVPGLIEARKSASEESAIGSLRTIAVAQAMFREGDKDGDGKLDYGTLEELAEFKLVDPVLGSGEKAGYRFTVKGVTDFTFQATAEPLEPGKTGQRSFFVDESGVIRFEHFEPAGPESPEIGG